MSSPNIQDTLRDGVEAARRGDKLTARRLLQQVLIQDRDNEVALMWMASVVDTVEDRRAYLLRALQVNPNNDRAREALRRLGYEPPPPGTAPAANAPRNAASSAPNVDADRRARSTSGASPFLVAAAIIGLVIIVIAALVITSPQTAQPTPNPNALSFLPSDTPMPPTASEAVTPTATVFTGIIVTRNPNAQDVLPPTFTPTETEAPTRTFTPTITPIPINNYRALISDYEINNSQPSLFRLNVQGEDERAIGGGEGYADIALSPNGDMIAFVRVIAAPSVAETTPEPDQPTPTAIPQALPQLFIAPIASNGGALGTPVQLTTMLGTQMSRPTWSGDGQTLVFASNEDGDFDLYSISVSGGSPQQLTRNTALDTSPTFRPNTNMVVFVSDMDSPGFTDLYTYDLGTEALMRLTDGEGNLFDPAWSYDGEQLAYISDANGDADLFIANAQGERPVQLTIDDGSAEDRAPAWSRDGAYIAFASNRDGTNFQWYAINLSNGDIERMNSSDRDAQRIVFLP